ncbi:MAG: hypothetical protein PUK73_04990, partial [Spirochaetota bacterium]|uniref:hypothetical protein n=1 Tax=Candidatus Avelusimicrobium faecicola TaxID=3416205 RepID=UPI002A609929|nr:hypothetical protein [Spirochaetota bacterium]
KKTLRAAPCRPPAKRLAPEPPSAGQIYFYPGILQLPTVGQVKCLYNSVKNKFYKRLQRGALNGNNTANGEQQQWQTAQLHIFPYKIQRGWY